MSSALFRFIGLCPGAVRQSFADVSFQDGDFILTQGEPVEAVYVLLEGETRVYHLTPNGINYLEYIYTPGELFGEIEALNGKPGSSSVRASSTCGAIAIPKPAFLDWMRADAGFSTFIAGQLADKLYQSSQASVTNITFPLRYRVLYYLWEAHQRRVAYVAKEDLVAGLGSNDRSVNRILKELGDARIVESDRGVIKLCSPADVLREMARYE
jgi:CRP-like cAMP-binding protein